MEAGLLREAVGDLNNFQRESANLLIYGYRIAIDRLLPEMPRKDSLLAVLLTSQILQVFDDLRDDFPFAQLQTLGLPLQTALASEPITIRKVQIFVRGRREVKLRSGERNRWQLK